MNKKNRRGVFKAIAACTLSAAMLLSGGCGSRGGQGGPGGPNAQQGGTICVITKQHLSFWDDVKKGAEDAGEEFGYDIVYSEATNDNDYSSQEAAIYDAIKKKAKAIVIAPNGKTELNKAFEDAEKAGIKIININSRADYEGVASFIRCSDYESGSVAARNAITLMQVKDPELAGLKNIAIIPSTAATSEERVAGFIDSFTSQASDAIAPIDMTETNEKKVKEARDAKIDAYKKGVIKGAECSKEGAAKEEAMKILQNNQGNISVMFGTNTNTTLGICEAIEELELENEVVVVGFNSDEKELAYIKTHVLDGTVIQNPYMMGYVGVRYAKRAITGDSVPSRMDTGAVFVNAENINDDFVQLMIYPDGKPDAAENTTGGEG
ncbi:MAG: substrate-binding domain-containing protein [Ruminococcus sp.]|uniref:sugar ABC transporter substrate-binding protein n=1 Tax=Ruminococcus sp. TaxID=41978 RepID=UPI0025DAB18A|nr:substrate-binding domain-containing protein [Ruminococcus sp.]MBR6996894.1 substrate-binding domain-containing protein [Ruminococcus sp.]